MLRWSYEATSEMNNKECFDPLVMSVIGARKESDRYACCIFIFPRKGMLQLWEGSDQLLILTTEHLGAMLFPFILSINVHHKTPFPLLYR